MTIRNIVKKIVKNTSNIQEAEQVFVQIFILQNPILEKYEIMIDSYWSVLIPKQIRKQLAQNFINEDQVFSLYDIVEGFEYLVPVKDKKEKGVVYTPKEIRDYIINNIVESEEIPYIIDPACGCGAFLLSATEILSARYHLTYVEVIEQYIYGIDIDQNALRKAKLLLTLASCLNEEIGNISFNLYCGDSLDKKFIMDIRKKTGGFDRIVGNPPYVRYRNLPDKEKHYYESWESAKGGNVDLYMPFFELGLFLLKNNGMLGYISPNGFIQGINGRNLRNYFAKKRYALDILDFREAQMFKNVTSYTCITFIRTSDVNGEMNYVRINERESLANHKFTKYNMCEFDVNKPWRMRESTIDNIIEKLESSGTPLGNWKIRNGLATLKNDLYFFSPLKEDEEFYYREYGGKQWKIEKKICKKIVKPNIIKTEKDLLENHEMAIFPYIYTESGISIIEKEAMSLHFPETYTFLLAYKNELTKRDKGHGKYPVWYAYGRTQGMNNFGKKLLIPYIAGKATAILSLDPDLLFYCGYALFSEDEEELRVIKCFMESDAFWYYIYHTSKPYSKGYMSFAKNYLIKFTIPYLSAKEKEILFSFESKEDMNKWIWSKYNIDEKELVDR